LTKFKKKNIFHARGEGKIMPAKKAAKKTTAKKTTSKAKAKKTKK